MRGQEGISALDLHLSERYSKNSFILDEFGIFVDFFLISKAFKV